MTKKTETSHSKNTTKQKVAQPTRKKIQHDAEYIAYIENGESGAVFITRDIADDIDTTGKWIDVVEVEFEKRHDKNDYKYFIVELFDRREHPKHTKGMTIVEKKYLTWQVATNDIDKQRTEGVIGPKYLVIPSLINLNKGKWVTVDHVWNKTFNRWVPNEWLFTSSCEWRKKKEYIPPAKDNWQYKIIATRKLDKKQFSFIQNNHLKILQKIEDNKAVKLEYFNLS